MKIDHFGGVPLFFSFFFFFALSQSWLLLQRWILKSSQFFCKPQIRRVVKFGFFFLYIKRKFGSFEWRVLVGGLKSDYKDFVVVAVAVVSIQRESKKETESGNILRFGFLWENVLKRSDGCQKYEDQLICLMWFLVG